MADASANAALIERFYSAFARRDVEAMLSCYCPDLTFKESAHWQACYAYSGTGRLVCNRIAASFEFRDGLIARHVDRFSLWRWAAMALGGTGALLGWFPPTRNAIRARAAQGLAAYRAANP